MRTVKEISDLTGISVRTLHYYDEIGLLKPTKKSDAGYRLYDDKALETLQQVLFFREFDIPLKEIKAVMENPVLERNQILQMQRKMLVAKKERMERLINSIDDILKGDNKMDFAIFSKTEVEEMFQTMIEHIISFGTSITYGDWGIATCSSSVIIDSGYKVSLTLTLQKSSGNDVWEDVESWSSEGNAGAAISERRALYSKYSYRVKATATVYDLNGNWIESETQIDY